MQNKTFHKKIEIFRWILRLLMIIFGNIKL